jgi:predicted NAD/FAD-dependent oxidoreductase
MGQGEEVVVVGAGVSGLACARALADAGRSVRVLERARGVGGRCATRRVDGQPIDFGVAFLHGRDAAFLDELDSVPARRLPGWPAEIHGTGRPCQPEAFSPGERRLAFAEGVSALPKHLARDLDVRLDARVEGLEVAGERLRLLLDDGEAAEARTLVLAIAAEQASDLLGTLPVAPPAVETARAILGMARSEACLALLATYPEGAPAPSWHVSYPEDSRLIQLAVHDSSKRERPAFLAMVYQAHPRWSRDHLDASGWAEAVLAEAGALFGTWAARPARVEEHRWRFARTGRSAELAAPLLLALPGGARLGIAGERFAPGGGVEAAWASGRMLARQILAAEER